MEIAATQLQALTKRTAAQRNISNIKGPKERIGAAAKRLLPERVS